MAQKARSAAEKAPAEGVPPEDKRPASPAAIDSRRRYNQWVRPVLLVVCALLPASLGLAQVSQRHQARVRRVVLDNGLRVQLSRVPSGSFAGLCVVYNAGRIHDPVSLPGLAELTHRAMGVGIRDAPAGVPRALEGLGAVRAFESIAFDSSAYCADVPIENLEAAIHLEASRMGFLLSDLSAADLRRQRDMLVRLHRRRGQRGLGLRVRQVEASALWRQHPYHQVSVSARGLARARLSHVQWFHQRHYGPANAALAVVTPGSIDDAERQVRHHFGGLRGYYGPSDLRAIVAPLPQAREVTINTRAFREELRLSWVTPPYFDQGDAALDVAANALKARLETAFEGDPITWLWVGVISRRLGSYFQIVVETARGTRALSHLPTVERELQQLREQMLSAEELTEGRERFIGFDAPPVDAAFFLASQALQGRQLEVAYEAQRYRDVTRSEVQQAVIRWLAPDARLLVYRRFDASAPDGGDVVASPQ